MLSAASTIHRTFASFGLSAAPCGHANGRMDSNQVSALTCQPDGSDKCIRVWFVRTCFSHMAVVCDTFLHHFYGKCLFGAQTSSPIVSTFSSLDVSMEGLVSWNKILTTIDDRCQSKFCRSTLRIAICIFPSSSNTNVPYRLKEP